MDPSKPSGAHLHSLSSLHTIPTIRLYILQTLSSKYTSHLLHPSKHLSIRRSLFLSHNTSRYSFLGLSWLPSLFNNTSTKSPGLPQHHLASSSTLLETTPSSNTLTSFCSDPRFCRWFNQAPFICLTLTDSGYRRVLIAERSLPRTHLYRLGGVVGLPFPILYFICHQTSRARPTSILSEVQSWSANIIIVATYINTLPLPT